MRTTKTVEVEVPELYTIQADAAAIEQLDTLCQAARVIQGQIKSLETTKGKLMDDGHGGGIKPLATALNLPERVLGTGWDLRRVDRTTETLDVAKLKLELLRLNIRFEIICECQQPKPAQESVDLMAALKASLAVAQPQSQATTTQPVACSLCQGTGRRTLEGLAAVNYLIAECTEIKQSTSWSVYARKEGTS
jgi:hypothetical protein